MPGFGKNCTSLPSILQEWHDLGTVFLHTTASAFDTEKSNMLCAHLVYLLSALSCAGASVLSGFRALSLSQPCLQID